MHKDYESLLKYFLKDAVYFVMKSSNQDNIELSMEQGVWSTPPQNEQKLCKAFESHRNVLLVFSAKESGRFAGFARLSSELIVDHPTVPWILPPSLAGKKLFNGVFKVDWISRREVPFTLTSHLFNPLNEGKPVKIARDGQQIDAHVGSELVSLFPRDQEVQMIPLLKRMKKQEMSRVKKLHVEQLHAMHQLPAPVQRAVVASTATAGDGDGLHHQRCEPHPAARGHLRVVLHNCHSSPDGGRRRVHVPSSSPYSCQRSQRLACRPDVRGELID